MPDHPRTSFLTSQQRAILELLDAGAWIASGLEGQKPVAIEGGPKNPPRVTRSDVESLVDAEMIYEVWDEEETMTETRYIISRMGQEYLQDNPSPLSRASSRNADSGDGESVR